MVGRNQIEVAHVTATDLVLQTKLLIWSVDGVEMMGGIMYGEGMHFCLA